MRCCANFCKAPRTAENPHVPLPRDHEHKAQVLHDLGRPESHIPELLIKELSFCRRHIHPDNLVKVNRGWNLKPGARPFTREEEKEYWGEQLPAIHTGFVEPATETYRPKMLRKTPMRRTKKIKLESEGGDVSEGHGLLPGSNVVPYTEDHTYIEGGITVEGNGEEHGEDLTHLTHAHTHAHTHEHETTLMHVDEHNTVNEQQFDLQHYPSELHTYAETDDQGHVHVHVHENMHVIQEHDVEHVLNHEQVIEQQLGQVQSEDDGTGMLVEQEGTTEEQHGSGGGGEGGEVEGIGAGGGEGGGEEVVVEVEGTAVEMNENAGDGGENQEVQHELLAHEHELQQQELHHQHQLQLQGLAAAHAYQAMCYATPHPALLLPADIDSCHVMIIDLWNRNRAYELELAKLKGHVHKTVLRERLLRRQAEKTRQEMAAAAAAAAAAGSTEEHEVTAENEESDVQQHEVTERCLDD